MTEPGDVDNSVLIPNEIELTQDELDQYPTPADRAALDPHPIYVARGYCPAINDFGSWCNLFATHTGDHRSPLIGLDNTVTWVTWSS